MSNQIIKSIVVDGIAVHNYLRWADFESFPKFVKEIESVKKIGDNTYHWIMRTPFGVTIEWYTEVTRWDEGKRIAWRSIGGDIKTSGQVTFTALPNAETEVTIMVHYAPSAGLDEDLAADLFADIEDKVLRNLRNFKAFAEAMPQRIEE
jgi:uncharacterized membrane protein